MIVITAPTGQIGAEVLTRVLAAEVPVRVIARDPSKLSDAARARAEVVTGSHGDPEVLERAFTGVDAVFWLNPPDFTAPKLSDFVDFTRPAAALFAPKGVRRVVGVSALGRDAGQNAGLVSASHEMDALIGACGVAYRALAMPSFMDNLLRQVVSLRTENVFRDVLSPEPRRPLVAVRDIAAVAADLLLDQSWEGVAQRPVLGPEDLSQNDLAAILSEVLGKPVHYRRTALDGLKEQLVGRGMSPDLAQARVDMLRAKENGLDLGTPRTPQTSSPTTFRQWCEEVLVPALRAG